MAERPPSCRPPLLVASMSSYAESPATGRRSERLREGIKGWESGRAASGPCVSANSQYGVTKEPPPILVPCAGLSLPPDPTQGYETWSLCLPWRWEAL